MPQQYGLGRGLSSLIPPKQSSGSDTSSSKSAGGSAREKDSRSNAKGFSYARDEDVSVEKRSGKREAPSSKERDMPESGILEVAVSEIAANSHQPRMHFDESKLAELAESIKTHGIIQPLVGIKKGGKYELIAGERRLRAARMAGLDKVPVVVREAPEKEKFELAILENVQRHDLSPMEEARAYRRLMDEFGLSQEDVALRIGKSRSAVANAVRFLDLPLEVQRGLEEGAIAPGHAKVILSLDNPEKQRALYDLILREHLTVRQAEDRAGAAGSAERIRTSTRKSDPQLKASEDELSEALGTKVRVSKMGEKGAKVAIDFYSKQELIAFLNKMRG